MNLARYLTALFFLMPTSICWADVRITNISDFTLGTWGMGDGPISSYIDLCIYNNAILPLGGPYAITVSSPGGFYLTASGRQIPYTLSWEDSGVNQLGSEPATPLSSGVKLTGQMNANTLSSTCAYTILIPAGPNARLYLNIAESDMTTALAGTYNGTITLLLSAN